MEGNTWDIRLRPSLLFIIFNKKFLNTLNIWLRSTFDDTNNCCGRTLWSNMNLSRFQLRKPGSLWSELVLLTAQDIFKWNMCTSRNYFISTIQNRCYRERYTGLSTFCKRFCCKLGFVMFFVVCFSGHLAYFEFSKPLMNDSYDWHRTRKILIKPVYENWPTNHQLAIKETCIYFWRSSLPEPYLWSCRLCSHI